jgi:hypothetical protein
VASNSSSAAQDGEEGKEGKNNEFKLTEKETKALDTVRLCMCMGICVCEGVCVWVWSVI